MRKKDKDQIRKKLEADKERIVRNASQTKDHINNPNPDDLNDEVDIATEESHQTLSLRLRDREAMLLAKIEKTLGKIEEDDFGYCDKCGSDIGLKRLLARPVASLCIRCKEEQEKVEKGYAD
jgi:RNA polymerase-binding transcription factor